jgi:hypothetical protein
MIMMHSDWTEQADGALLGAVADGRSWDVIGRQLGLEAGLCQRRHRALTEVEPPARKCGPNPDEDGLDRLIRKGRLTPSRLAAALYYRDLVRDAAMATAVHADSRSAVAERELSLLRSIVLGGQTDLLAALDGVCGARLTVAAIAGQPARARVIEALLWAALDLVHSHTKSGKRCE